jgi:hypothetical protein
MTGNAQISLNKPLGEICTLKIRPLIGQKEVRNNIEKNKERYSFGKR